MFTTNRQFIVQERLKFYAKKHLYFTISIALLSVLHWLFSYFYIRLYGYFNLQGSLNQFLLFTQVFRFVLNFYIIFVDM